MVGLALGGRDPVRELVPPPPLPVPPPLRVSCREESWPGTEMDLAVDGGLGRKDGCDWGAPCSGSKTGEPKSPEVGRVPVWPPTACAHTHVLKQGSPESRSIPMVTCTEGEISHTMATPRPRGLPAVHLLWLQMGWPLILSLPLAGPGEATEPHRAPVSVGGGQNRS